MEIKAYLLVAAILLACAAAAIYIPNRNHGFDSSWECPPAGRGGAVVCIKKH